MSKATRHDQLTAHCWWAQGELDREQQAVERAVRYFDSVPDGDRRKHGAEQNLNLAMARMHAAERAAGDAAEALLAYEAEHGQPQATRPTLPFENGL
jgi:hypothetical protein